jgi:phage shock protein C
MNGHLYRSRDDRVLAGVAGGLAEIWDADPSLVRIVWALLVVLTGGIALVLYIIMAIVVPEEEDELPAGTAPTWAAAQPEAGATEAPAASGEGGAAPVAGVSGSPSGWDAGPPVAGWTPPAPTRDARAARRAARRTGRRRGSGAVPAFFGVVLVLLGVWFLVRQYLPAIDFDWFWPLALVGLGVVILVVAVGRGPGQRGGSTPGAGAAG